MILEVKNICKSYSRKQVLCDVSFSLNAGEVVGFLGPNGAGKSTLMKIATGFLQADSGEVVVCGERVAKNNLTTHRLVGYLPEHNPLYNDMYVLEYLDFAAKFYDIDGRKKRIAEVIEQIGLGDRQHMQIGQLSKGYRQRVGLAQALIPNPPLLILDEPLTGLDPNQLVEIRQIIANYSKEKTVLFSTHIMQEVQSLCERAIIINSGKIVANDTLAHIANGDTLENRFHELTAKKI